MKRLILAGAVALAAIASLQISPSQALSTNVNCALVRCMACPDGYHFAPTSSNCCRCLPN